MDLADLAFPTSLRARAFWILAFLLVALAVAAALAWFEVQRTLEVPGGRVEVRVTAGATVRSIARQLQEAGIPLRRSEFVLAASLTRSTRNLRAGRYVFGPQTSVLALVEKFRHGEVEREQLAFVEGSGFAQMRATIAACPDLRHDTGDWSEAQILRALGASQARAEGLFAPDTYTFDPYSSDLEVYRQAYLAQKERLDHAWAARSADLPYTDPYQALIMASIVERETGKAEERGLVAAVFVNRLRLGMPLQTDPTVIYGLGAAYQGRLHRRDLEHDTPYNTYTRAGLPPTPISLPGRAAISAALNPEAAPVLYFVARGDGSSVFSQTLAEHNRAVDRYQRAANGQGAGAGTAGKARTGAAGAPGGRP